MHFFCHRCDDASYKYGQNIYVAARSNADANPDLLGLSFKGWYYDEKAWYNYKDNSCSPTQPWGSCAHYTQASSL